MKKSRSSIEAVTCTAPVNIAVIKYWGKRDVGLNLPCNSSLSGTLNQDHLKTTTTIAASRDFEKDRLWLNGAEQDMSNPRLQVCLSSLRAMAKAQGDPKNLADCKVHICSINNFPTAAGLASSASGYACLVFTLAKLLDLKADTETLSTVARQGSGSACRSLFGGFVKWEMGSREDGSDSRAVQVAPETHWPEMQVLILVVSDHKKAVSSTSGMQNSMRTSPFLKHRAEAIVPQRMAQMEEAIHQRDFERFGMLTIQDSNQFHATCLDTYPPVFYMNDVSRLIVHLLTRLNAEAGRLKAAYTFDAGPNACIYALQQDVPAILAAVLHFFPPAEGQEASQYFNDRLGVLGREGTSAAQEPWFASVGFAPQPGTLRYILHTNLADGPRVLPESASLLDSDGNPKQ